MSKEQLSRYNRFISLKIICGLAGLSFILSGCTSTTGEAMPSPDELLRIDKLLEDLQPKYSDCTSHDADQPELQRQKAMECAEVYSNFDVALVNYSLSEDEAKSFADTLELRFETTTSELIDLDVTVITPSEKSIELLASQNPSGCINIMKLGSYGSYIANAAMPELNKYDNILAIENYPSCDSKAGGVAFEGYTEVFEVGPSLEEIEANGGKFEVTTTTESGLVVARQIFNPYDTAAHELLHLLGLGNSGTLNNHGLDLIGWMLSEGANHNYTLNLREYVASGDYGEYAGDDIMGDPSIILDDKKLNTIHQYALEWPAAILKKESSVTGFDIAAGPVTFDKDTPESTLVFFDFNTFVYPPPGQDSDVSDFSKNQEFNRLAFTPKKSDVDGQLDGVHVYLVSENNNIMSLGYLSSWNSDGASHYQINLDGQIVTIIISNNTITLSAS